MNWDDETVPVGKRKVAFVKWLMSAPRKVPLKQAQLMSYKKFYKEEHPNSWRFLEAQGTKKEINGDYG